MNAASPLPRGIEVPDTGGLICGFVLEPKGPVEGLRWRSDATEIGRVPESDKPLWLHFNFTDTRADLWIAACGKLAKETREFLLDDDARVRAEPLGDGVGLVLSDLHHDFESDPDGIGQMRIHVGPTLVITGRRHPLESVNRLRRELIDGASITSSVDWLSHFVHQMCESFSSVVGALGTKVDEAEDRILAERMMEEGKELGHIRRLLARLRRHLSANRQALVHSRARLSAWCSDADAGELRLAIERLEGVGQDLELVQERARLLQEEIAARLGEATNRNLYLLSIVTAVLMPVTLITGVFGMNVGGLPYLQDRVGFWWVMLLMGATVVGTLIWLRRRGIF